MSIPDNWPSYARKRAAKFLALWKYYRFSRSLSEAATPFYQRHLDGQLKDSLDGMRGIAFLSYWIASLEVLSEGWTGLGLTDAAINPLLTDAHRATLRNYRHTVFHFQADLDEKRIVALTASHAVVDWVFVLGEAYQSFFEPHAQGIDVELIRTWLFAPAG